MKQKSTCLNLNYKQNFKLLKQGIIWICILIFINWLKEPLKRGTLQQSGQISYIKKQKIIYKTHSFGHEIMT